MSFEQVITEAQDEPSLRLNHTCIRVKDPKRSVKFYEDNFGMKLIRQKDFPDMKFSLYFLTFVERKQQLGKDANGNTQAFNISGVLELTHNWGTETDPDYKVNNGNEEPHRGFGHICFGTHDIGAACADLESKNVTFKKRLSDGRQKDIAFILDPDNYWIELVQYVQDGMTGYCFNHTMYRIKDPVKSVNFYQNVLGMKLLQKSVHENAKFTLYFLGYQKKFDDKRSLEGVLELTHNWGTEDDTDFKYHTGNTEPQGYGHICISLDKPAELCQQIETTYGDKVQWAPKWNQGKMKQIAFIKDPDGYSIEVVPSHIAL